MKSVQATLLVGGVIFGTRAVDAASIDFDGCIANTSSICFPIANALSAGTAYSQSIAGSGSVGPIAFSIMPSVHSGFATEAGATQSVDGSYLAFALSAARKAGALDAGIYVGTGVAMLTY